MNKQDISNLMELLNNFASIPCEFNCKDEYETCPLFEKGHCEVLYYTSRFIVGKLTLDEFINEIECNFKNTKNWD